MREIKFRGKRVDNGEWVYGYYIEVFNQPSNVHLIFPKDEHEDSFACAKRRDGKRIVWDELNGLIEVLPETVGQYTGLKDKNGAEIYEGDIVENQYKARRIVKRTKYGEYRLFCGEHASHFINGWEKGIAWIVIGNIHDNPELLGE